jgi:chromosome segregation ATPase
MRILKFNESEELVDISSERIEEITKELKELISIIDDKENMIYQLYSELNGYKGKSKKDNDQVDDSISNLQLAKGSISDCKDKIDSVILNLKDYNDNGRKFLY